MATKKSRGVSKAFSLQGVRPTAYERGDAVFIKVSGRERVGRVCSTGVMIVALDVYGDEATEEYAVISNDHKVVQFMKVDA